MSHFLAHLGICEWKLIFILICGISKWLNSWHYSSGVLFHSIVFPRVKGHCWLGHCPSPILASPWDYMTEGQSFISTQEGQHRWSLLIDWVSVHCLISIPLSFVFGLFPSHPWSQKHNSIILWFSSWIFRRPSQFMCLDIARRESSVFFISKMVLWLLFQLYMNMFTKSQW